MAKPVRTMIEMILFKFQMVKEKIRTKTAKKKVPKRKIAKKIVKARTAIA